MTTPITAQQEILRKIETWPVEDQVALAHLILEHASMRAATARPPSWRQLAGLAATGHPPPSDEEVARWLDERRVEKYG
ncbi:MAG TPA: hypothetical protein VIJ28_09935 [Chloroflexota bacterium]